MVVAFNASTTIARTLDRIPSNMEGLAAILLSDDHSADDTAEVASTYASRHTDLPITVIRQPRNLGYGGNQKTCYRLALEHNLAERRARRATAEHPENPGDKRLATDEAERIAKGLRCPVCQGEAIDDSNAPISRDLRLLVRERLVVKEGRRIVIPSVKRLAERIKRYSQTAS